MPDPVVGFVQPYGRTRHRGVVVVLGQDPGRQIDDRWRVGRADQGANQLTGGQLTVPVGGQQFRWLPRRHVVVGQVRRRKSLDTKPPARGLAVTRCLGTQVQRAKSTKHRAGPGMVPGLRLDQLVGRRRRHTVGEPVEHVVDDGRGRLICRGGRPQKGSRHTEPAGDADADAEAADQARAKPRVTQHRQHMLREDSCEVTVDAHPRQDVGEAQYPFRAPLAGGLDRGGNGGRQLGRDRLAVIAVAAQRDPARAVQPVVVADGAGQVDGVEPPWAASPSGTLRAAASASAVLAPATARTTSVMVCTITASATVPRGEWRAITERASSAASANRERVATDMAIGQAGCKPASVTRSENASMSASSSRVESGSSIATCAIADQAVTRDRLSRRRPVRFAAQLAQRKCLGLIDCHHTGGCVDEVVARHGTEMLTDPHRKPELLGAVEGGEIEHPRGSRRHQETHQADPLRGGVDRVDAEHDERAAVDGRRDRVEQTEQRGQPPRAGVAGELDDAVSGHDPAGPGRIGGQLGAGHRRRAVGAEPPRRSPQLDRPVRGIGLASCAVQQRVNEHVARPAGVVGPRGHGVPAAGGVAVDPPIGESTRNLLQLLECRVRGYRLNWRSARCARQIAGEIVRGLARSPAVCLTRQPPAEPAVSNDV